jgi:hypothetical protein
VLPTDPFDTAELRRTVLDAWAASPARFREDANAEEDYALGGYRDRLVVELAQNAADAASRAGVPGSLRLTLASGVLTAANTGAPLDADGVVALSTLRASAKRDEGTGGAGGIGGTGGAGGAVGRFGVGFAATVAVSDAPSIASATGAVRWSRDETSDLVAGIPALAGELAAREGHVPVLRLPFPSGDVPPEGFTTAVTLPLRDAGAIELTRRLLAETGPALLLALPALAEVTIETPDGTRCLVASREQAGGNEDGRDGDIVTVTVDGTASTWRTAASGGRLDPALLADRPAEERARAAWSVRWAVPLAPEAQSPPAGSLPQGTAAVVHAPTPTDEPLALPALLLASFPLSPDRRHVAPGPLTDFLIIRAAETYAGLLPRLMPGPGLLDLVPGPVAHGELDGQLRRAVLALLPETPFLPAAENGDPGDADRHPGEPARLRPRDALLIEADLPGLAGFLAPVLAGLVTGPVRHPAYRALGVRRLSLAELTDTLGALDRSPSWWRGLYDALAAADPEQRAELGALPVPLADGRLVRGPRGLLLPGTGLEHPQRLAVLGLRIVHPDAVSAGGGHPLLARLGAVEATPRSVLNDPATRAAVENSFEEEDPAPVAEAVLGLVAAADLEPGGLPWLGNLALPGDDGDWYPADELLLPGSALAEVMADDAPFGVVGAEFAARHGADVLEKAGVLSTFGLLRAEDVDLGDPDLDVDGADDWADDVRARLRGGPGQRDNAGPDDDAGPRNGDVPPFAPEVLAVRDLDLVDPGRWPRALELLTRPPLRAALTEPTRVLLGDGRYADVPSYAAWWLRHHLIVGGQRPGGLRAPGSDPLLAGLYDEAVPELTAALADPEIARVLGIRTSLAEVLAEPGGPDDLLHRMADPARPVTRGQLRALWAGLGAADGAPGARVTQADVTPPDRVRAVRGVEVVVADADEALVLDAPDLWPLAAHRPLILAPHDLALRLADLLDLPLASEEIAGAVESSGERRPVPEIVADAAPDAPPHYYAHDKLLVDGVAVPWRVRDGEAHAASPAGLARALAWAAGQWPLRHLLAALLTAPDDAARLLADADLDPG